MLITDPDLLNSGVEVTIDPVASTIKLNLAGNLSADGVTGQALFSFLKDLWKADAELIKYKFPMLAITPEQFEFGNNGSKFSNWKLFDDASRKLVRTAGWKEYDSTGSTLREYAGIISLGVLGSTDQTYFQQANGSAPVNSTYLGALNEAVQIYGNAVNGNVNFRSHFKLFVREQGKVYAASDLSAIGVTTMTYQVYRFPLANSPDSKITATDIQIDANGDGTADVAPYSLMGITYLEGIGFTAYANATVYPAKSVVSSAGRWFYTAAGGTSNGATVALDSSVTWTPYTGEKQIGATYYPFNIIVDGAEAVAEKIYEFAQWSLRQTVDIDEGAAVVTGKTADALLEFVGEDLRTMAGVFITGLNSNDTNRVKFKEVNGLDGIYRTYPFVAAASLTFNASLTDDPDAKYWVFFKNANGNEIDTEDAIIVNDNAGTPITGNVGGTPVRAFDFDYDGNVQGGRTAGQDAVIVIRAIGLATGAFVEAEYTIVRAVGQNFSLVSPLERNYSNPA